MEARALFIVAFFLGLIGLSYGIYHTTEIDDASRNLRSLTQQVKILQEHLDEQTQVLESRKAIATLLAANRDLSKTVDALNGEVREERLRQDERQQAFGDAVAKVRQESLGMRIAEIRLTNGSLLKDAKVQRVEEDGISFSHSEGVLKVAPDAIPADLADRFRLTGSVAVAPPPASPAESELPIAAAGSELRKKLAEIMLRRSRLEKELPYLTEQLRALNLDTADSSASKRYYAKKQKVVLEGQITQVRRQIDAADLEIVRLRTALRP